jgi:hypothetical protein
MRRKFGQHNVLIQKRNYSKKNHKRSEYHCSNSCDPDNMTELLFHHVSRIEPGPGQGNGIGPS